MVEQTEPSSRGTELVPAISVVVPFYNSERYVAASVEALLAQEGVEGDYEIILVDNGSQDASPSIVQRYAGVTVLAEDTPGAYAARNTGIRRARGALIALTDADCVVSKTWLRSIQEGMQDPTTGILVGHCRYPEEASRPLRLLGAYENAKAAYVIGRLAPEYHFAYANNMAVRASLFEELGPFREWRRAGDSEFVHRMASKRPELRIRYRSSIRMTHREFLHGRDRARRLSLYTETNSKIETFRELGVGHRFGVLLQMLKPQSTGTQGTRPRSR